MRTSYPTRKAVPLMELINKFFNSISAILPLPSATLLLPLFKILPLPFPITSRAALGCPAKITISIQSNYEGQTGIGKNGGTWLRRLKRICFILSAKNACIHTKTHAFLVFSFLIFLLVFHLD